MVKDSQRLRIFANPEDVAAPPTRGRLFLSGLSVILYYGLHLRRGTLEQARSCNSFREIIGDMSYDDKMRVGTGLHYTELLPAGELPSPIASASGASTTAIKQSLLWLDPEYALAVVPLVFSVPRSNPPWDSVPLIDPIGVDDVLAMLSAANNHDTTEALIDSAVCALQDIGVLDETSILRTVPMTDSIGIQLWDLEGSVLPGRRVKRPLTPYVALAESQGYAWEISALMSYPVDHIIQDHLWRKRNPGQVFNDVGSGYTMLGDHMVFVNHCCCLEISHLPIGIKKRSKFRMQNYGYDSSAIFVWTLSNLRSMVIGDLRNMYRNRVWELIEKDSLPSSEIAILAKEQPRHFALADQLMSMSEHLREKRLRELDAEILVQQYSRDPIGPLQRDMEKVREITISLVKARHDSFAQANNTLLAFLAVVLAVVGIPTLVQQIANWFDGSQWLRLVISLAAMVGILIILFIGWRRRSRWK